MKYKIYLLSLLFIFLLMSSKYNFHNKDVRNVSDITARLSESISFKNYIASTESIINPSDRSINIYIESKDSFENLDLHHQFTLLEHFTKQLRFLMHNGVYTTSLGREKISLKTKSSNNKLHLINELTGNQPYQASQSTFYINNEIKNTSHSLRQALKKHMDQNPNTAYELEILDYAKYFYRILTQSGKYYDIQRDGPIILDAICEKFDITPEEYDEIYMKHFLGLDI